MFQHFNCWRCNENKIFCLSRRNSTPYFAWIMESYTYFCLFDSFRIRESWAYRELGSFFVQKIFKL